MPLNTTLQLLTLTLGLLSQLTQTVEQNSALPPQQLTGLAELSGLTLTRNDLEEDGVIMWGHNDSGNQAEVIALNAQGERLLTVEIDVEVFDLEDIDAAPCPLSLGKQTCLWLADVGDNHGLRKQVQLLIFPVPQLQRDLKNQKIKLSAEQVLTIPFYYPNGVRPNVEAMTVSQEGEVWLFEKSDETWIRVWAGHVEQTPSQSQLVIDAPKYFSLQKIMFQSHRSTRFLRVTGADLSEDDQTLALRTYGAVYLFHDQQHLSLQTLEKTSSQMIEISEKIEPQGESVVLDLEHQGLWTASEQKGDCIQQLHFTSLASFGS